MPASIPDGPRESPTLALQSGPERAQDLCHRRIPLASGFQKRPEMRLCERPMGSPSACPHRTPSGGAFALLFWQEGCPRLTRRRERPEFWVLRRRSLAKTVSQACRCLCGTCEGRTGRSGCTVYSFLGCIISSTKCALCPQLMLGTGRMCSPSAQRHNGEFEHRWHLVHDVNSRRDIGALQLDHLATISVHTMQGANQQPSSSAVNDSLSTLAFLGQQLRQFSSSMPQQRHQNQPLQSSSLGFSLSVNGQEQGHGHQNHQQQHSQSMLLGGGGGGQANGGNRSGERLGGMFQHLQQQGNMNSNLDPQQFGNQMMNSGFSDNISSQSMVEQNVQGIMEHLSMLQERIQQLQALVPLIAQTAHCQTESNVVAQQQAASAAVVSIISQLAMAAIGLLPQPFGISGGQGNQSTELPLSQLLQAAVNPAANFFQNTLGSDLRAPQRGTSINNLLNNNIFGTSAATAAVSGVNTGVNGIRSFSNGGGSQAFPGLNSEADLSGQQNLTGQQPGGSNNSPAMSLHNQMTNSGIGKDFGSVGGSGGKTRGGAVNPSNIINSSLAPGASASNFISELGGMNTGLEDLDNDSRVDDEDSDGENLPPGSFDLVELDATEILAEHTHFCEICGKGFKRDANLRMHMRGHGDEYKTPAALARPDRGTQDTTVTRSRRFSCPYVGCKRNKKHRKFQPLKTMLCVKNHYRRSHCPKVLTCQKCMAKKFSVVADLKTHEKHCGRDKWLCSCGTTFSRKDKLFGHIGLFQGHTPAMPMHELEGGSGGGNGNAPVPEHQESPTEGSFGSETKSSMREDVLRT